MITSTVTFGNGGIINSLTDVGGWHVLNSLPSPLGSGQDGMPDKWENQVELNRKDQADLIGD
ncbi:MAG: hypothetical protein KAI99_19255 [Cyclobacteriaceae bacterium]|nr:hypothetical protein [Cyclobacteriaceae bacterium]MCK5470674.1 hypothetical protein [Cyclobacteriaceae bacterium]